MKPNSAVLWRGDSLLDGAPLVVIATGHVTPPESFKRQVALAQEIVDELKSEGL